MASVLEAPKLYRRSRSRMVGGVAGGIADHLRIRALPVRAAFLVATAAGGIGVVIYAVFWIVLPAEPAPDRRIELTALEYVAAAVAATIALASATWTAPFGDFFIPAALGCLGAALMWRQAGNHQRERWRQLSRTSLGSTDDGWSRARVAVGAGLVIVGCAAVLATADFSAMRNGLEAVVVTIVGMALITGPWWVRMVTDLGEERRERIRSQERADLAAHIHDSVLQTLALIQRNADSPREVARLARGQERELRNLLYAGEHPPTESLAETIRTAAAEVEDAYAVHIDVVLVGDTDLTDDSSALVLATREAMVNAARHAGVDTVSVYVEVEQAAVVAYVRDRGAGFDPDEVADDRHGVRGSIVARIERHRGQASVHSVVGEGTEVTIRVPR